MQEGKRREPTPPAAVTPRGGLGTACFEAQADGVPCSDVGARCGDCDRARSQRQARQPLAPPGKPANDHA